MNNTHSFSLESLNTYAGVDGVQELLDQHLDEVSGAGWSFNLFGKLDKADKPDDKPKKTPVASAD